MTSPFEQARIHADSPAELLALVPYVLGFHPTNSLVTVALRDHRLAQVARVDLPITTDQRLVAEQAVRQVVAALSGHHVTGAILIGYGTAAQVCDTIAVATEALAVVSVPIVDVLRVYDGRYFSLICQNPRCCPAAGIPFDPATSVAAAQATAVGLVALPDRAALAARLAPITGAARDRMAAATVSAIEFLLGLTKRAAQPGQPPAGAGPDPLFRQAILATARTHLSEVRERYRAGRPVSDRQAALATVLLSVAPVRETAARHTNGDQWQLDMWVDLARRAEPEFALAPHILLTLAALQAGEGILANVAIERALNIDPDDRLANVLAQAIAACIDPATVTALLAG